MPLYVSRAVVAFIHRPEGTGVGRPQDTVNVIVTDYNESNPATDMVKWEAELTFDGVVTSVTQ